MKAISEIKSDLAKHGYNWPPQYKDILMRVWAQMETYFDEDEEVMSALWASFKRYEEEMIGIVFITTKRTFTIEVQETGATQLRYLPFDSYSLQKIQFQPASSDNALNYVSLQNDSFGNGITFACPNYQVSKHFVETLGGRTNGIIEVLPESDDPLLAANEREQVVTEEPVSPEVHEDHKFEEKHEEEKPVQENPLWNVAPKENHLKEVEIKIVPPKSPKPKKVKANGYGTKYKSWLWVFWLLIPFALIAIAIVWFLFI